MKRIIHVSLILFLIFSAASLEAKGRGGKGSVVAKVIAKTVSKSIPKIKKMINSSKRSKHLARKQIRKNVPKITGIYKFKASNNKPYLGKSVKTKNQDVQKRLIQHINSGKLHPKDINTISFAKVAKKDVSKVERARIMRGDKITKGNLANKYHAPWSREKAKVLKESREKREQLLKIKF